MRVVRGLLVRLAAVLLAALVACAAAPAADSPGARIARGVRVGDVVLTGLTAQPARERLRRELARPLEFTVGARSWQIPASRFDVSADVDAAVRTALSARPGGAIRPGVTMDGKAVRGYVDWLARRFAVPPRDAYVIRLDAKLNPVLARGRYGRKLDRRGAERAIRNALAAGTREGIRLPFVAVAPKTRVGPVVVIRRESKRLTLYAGERKVRTFGVATGQWAYPTPLGRFDVVSKAKHPWWYPPPSDWAKGLEPVPPGPGNPLGTRWMGISSPSVGIHGTPDAASIGYSASHGCIRMRVPDAEWLFDRVEVGTPVFIVSA